MLMLVNYSNYRTPLKLPPDAKSIRRVLCQGITHIFEPREITPSTSNNYSSAPSHPLPPPSPYNHSPPGPPPPTHGRKKAVICGISYRHSPNKLKGCINDAKCMRYLLVNCFKFLESSIIMLIFEQKRGHVASAVECYMNEHGMSEQETFGMFCEMVVTGWKDINQECLKPSPLPMALLVRAINLTRVLHVIYLNGDGYTHSSGKTKAIITTLLVDPIPV